MEPHRGDYVLVGRYWIFFVSTHNVRELWIVYEEKFDRMLEIHAQVHIRMEAQICSHLAERWNWSWTLFLLLLLFPIWSKLSFPTPPIRAPSLAFFITDYGSSIFFPVVQSQNFNSSSTPIFIANPHLIVKEIMSIAPKSSPESEQCPLYPRSHVSPIYSFTPGLL